MAWADYNHSGAISTPVHTIGQRSAPGLVAWQARLPAPHHMCQLMILLSLQVHVRTKLRTYTNDNRLFAKRFGSTFYSNDKSNLLSLVIICYDRDPHILCTQSLYVEPTPKPHNTAGRDCTRLNETFVSVLFNFNWTLARTVGCVYCYSSQVQFTF